MLHFRPAMIMLLLVLVGTGQLWARADEPSIPSSSQLDSDCGLRSLYLLLQTMGIETTFESLRKRLPETPPRGFSIGELRNASASAGLPLEAIRFDSKYGKIKHPAIVYLSHQDEGHFVFIRPVGETGRLIEVLEYPFAPKIMDLDYFVLHSGWNGIAIVPSANRSILYTITSLAVIGSLAILANLWVRRKVREG